MSDDLPLTIPVHMIVMEALIEVRGSDGLCRDEAYLLARLEAGKTDDECKAALLKAIEEAPD